MRDLTMAVPVLAVVALAAVSARPVLADNAGLFPAQRTAMEAPAAEPMVMGSDSGMRTMYVAMGAMTGYMFAVMPVTTTAISVAVASGVATMWAYDYMVGGPTVMPGH